MVVVYQVCRYFGSRHINVLVAKYYRIFIASKEH